MVVAFYKLYGDKSVTAVQVAEALEEYASSGSGISAVIVTELIDRTKPDADLRAKMIQSAIKGKKDQAQRGFDADAQEYLDVAKHLAS